MIRALFLGLILLGCSSCITLDAIRHDPDLAAQRATLFAKEAFIDLNQPEAYEFLSDELKQKVTLDGFIGVIAQMHPGTFPSEVTATDYEPILGQKAMVIWLSSENEKEKFYYQLTMAGTVETDYKVAALFRVPEIPPSNVRKPLASKPSSADLK